MNVFPSPMPNLATLLSPLLKHIHTTGIGTHKHPHSSISNCLQEYASKYRFRPFGRMGRVPLFRCSFLSSRLHWRAIVVLKPVAGAVSWLVRQHPPRRPSSEEKCEM